MDPEKTHMSIDNNPDKVDVLKVSRKMKKNPWMISTIVLAVVIIGYVILNLTGVTGNFVLAGGISAEQAGDKVVEYLNARTGGGVEFVSAENDGSLYKVFVKYQGQDIPVFVTKDGNYFVQGAVPMEVAETTTPTQSESQPQEITKSDKPEVELFVMTHCPYGTQSEKGIIPALETLGDNIDGNIKFVHYFMHKGEGQEPDETPIQVCIREEQSSKYLDYLKCFLKDGDSDRCIKEVKISKSKLNSCIKDNSEKYYAADSELSEGYGVKGSPTLVINGQIVNSGRDSASYLSVICSAFNEPPAECKEELSSTSPSPGFGYAEGKATSASCS